MRILFIILLAVVSKFAIAQAVINPYVFSSGGGSITAPTFVSETETAWNSTTSPKTTASISVQTGDVLVAFSIAEDHASDVTISNSGTALTWTLQQSVVVTNYTIVNIWTTTATSTTSFTVTFTRQATARFFGGNVLVFRGSGGIGASSKTNVSSSTPSLSLTTTQANSAIVVANGDWNATDGASRTWLTVNSITPSSGNGLEVTYFRNTTNYATYGAYYSNAGTAGSKTVGLSAPSGQTYSIVAVEVKGQ